MQLKFEGWWDLSIRNRFWHILPYVLFDFKCALLIYRFYNIIIPQFRSTDIRNWSESKCCGYATELF